MITLISVISVLSVLCVCRAEAGQIMYTTLNYKNVGVSSPTLGERYIHSQILGRYAEMLAAELGYSREVIIALDYYNPGYNGVNMRFRAGYGPADWRWDKKGKWRERAQKRDAIKIWQNSDKVDITEILKLLEYAILNRDELEARQQPVTFEREYHGPFTTSTLPARMIDSILRQPVSPAVGKVLSNRIYRKDIKSQFSSISYYAQNGRFYVYREVRGDEDPVVVGEFDHIWQFEPVRYSEGVGSSTAVVFDTPTTFRYAEAYEGSHIGSALLSAPPYLSPQHSIGRGSVAVYPSVVRALGRELVSIVMKSYAMLNPKDRTMIYVITRDALIPDLEKLLDSQLE